METVDSYTSLADLNDEPLILRRHAVFAVQNGLQLPYGLNSIDLARIVEKGNTREQFARDHSKISLQYISYVRELLSVQIPLTRIFRELECSDQIPQIFTDGVTVEALQRFLRSLRIETTRIENISRHFTVQTSQTLNALQGCEKDLYAIARQAEKHRRAEQHDRKTLRKNYRHLVRELRHAEISKGATLRKQNERHQEETRRLEQRLASLMKLVTGSTQQVHANTQLVVSGTIDGDGSGMLDFAMLDTPVLNMPTTETTASQRPPAVQQALELYRKRVKREIDSDNSEFMSLARERSFEGHPLFQKMRLLTLLDVLLQTPAAELPSEIAAEIEHIIANEAEEIARIEMTMSREQRHQRITFDKAIDAMVKRFSYKSVFMAFPNTEFENMVFPGLGTGLQIIDAILKPSGPMKKITPSTKLKFACETLPLEDNEVAAYQAVFASADIGSREVALQTSPEDFLANRYRREKEDDPSSEAIVSLYDIYRELTGKSLIMKTSRWRSTDAKPSWFQLFQIIDRVWPLSVEELKTEIRQMADDAFGVTSENQWNEEHGKDFWNFMSSRRLQFLRVCKETLSEPIRDSYFRASLTESAKKLTGKALYQGNVQLETHTDQKVAGVA